MNGTASGGADAVGDDPVVTDGECRVWLAEGGSDDNDGSEANPMGTLQGAYDKVCPKPASGTDNGAICEGPAPRTLCIKSGIYQVDERFEFKKTRMGEEDNRVIVMGDPNSSEKPVLDFSGQPRVGCGDNPGDGNLGCITINAWYVTVKDVEITGANDNCILLQGYEGLVENVAVHD